MSEISQRSLLSVMAMSGCFSLRSAAAVFLSRDEVSGHNSHAYQPRNNQNIMMLPPLIHSFKEIVTNSYQKTGDTITPFPLFFLQSFEQTAIIMLNICTIMLNVSIHLVKKLLKTIHISSLCSFHQLP